MAIPSVMADMSTTAASNTPAGSEAPTNADDYLRAIQGILRTTNAKGADIASASTTDIGAATAEFVDVTGTTTITALGTIAAGIVRTVRFTGTLTLTYNATSLILPGLANITTANGDTAVFRSLGSGNWKCISYVRQDGSPLALGANSVSQSNLATAFRLQLNLIQDFRLTLTSGTAVTSSDVTGATTVYCCPYKGNAIALYDGTNWNIRTSAQFSLALGTLTSGRPYDVWCYDNAGTPTLELLAWTNDTTRATGLTYQDGVLVKSGDTTRRYLGTFYTTATTTTEDSLTKRFLWNYYNRVARPMLRRESTATWNYTTATVRQANANAANQLDFLVGVQEDAINVNLNAMMQGTGTVVVAVGLGLDSTTTVNIGQGGNGFTTNSAPGTLVSTYSGLPGLGRHFIAWLETSTAVGTTTWQGNVTSAGAQGFSGLSGTIFG